MVIVGCTSVTSGTGEVDPEAAPVYRASVSASVEESIAQSSARESERQQSLTTAAIHTACEDLSSSSVNAIGAVNAYVDAVNENSPEVGARAGPAVEALDISANLVSSGISEVLSPELGDALGAWVGAARDVAGTIRRDAGPDEFNAAVTRLDASREVALELCDASY
ncbi:hypothetical protein [Mycolicibacterium doricum]|jgi:hypothetical protein|nr:hypothetical protein [Mycolicibacterium doricum]MCV7267167.1 hypothetical protein [Mycolicibacterium doricum]ORV40313.1 hypothetical protein AWC01_12315 [Mycolicibacterium doricum]